MGSLGRYVFRTTMVAFLITVVSLTVVMWFTQAMREFDLITSERQTLLVFVGITGLIVPLLVMMIAPIALVLAVTHVLNKLSTDSEIIVMNAAGVSPWRLVVPFVAAGRRGVAPRGRPGRLYLAAQLTRAARLGHGSAHRYSHQHRTARSLHHRRRQPHLPHRRPAPEWIAGWNIPRRPTRSQGARHLPRGAGRNRQERQRLVPRAWKEAALSG